MDSIAAAAGAFGLALVHLLADRVHSRNDDVRGRWLSFAGGTSVAFVFLHLIPELGRGQQAIGDTGLPRLFDDHVHLVALVGVVVYYGAERFALQRTDRGPDRRPADPGGSEGFFWAHIGLFTLFNLLTGFVMVREAERQPLPVLAVLFAALALHLFTNDFALRDHHRDEYHRIGRWVLAGAVLMGWAAARFLDVGEAAFVMLLAFAAGGIVLNALKEELPAERESHFGAFALGAAVYAVLMLVV